MLKISLTSSICKKGYYDNNVSCYSSIAALTLFFLTSTERDVRKVQLEYSNKTLKKSIVSVYLLFSAT